LNGDKAKVKYTPAGSSAQKTEGVATYVGDIVANTVDAQYIVDHGGLTVEGLSELSGVRIKALAITQDILNPGTFTIGGRTVGNVSITKDGQSYNVLYLKND